MPAADIRGVGQRARLSYPRGADNSVSGFGRPPSAPRCSSYRATNSAQLQFATFGRDQLAKSRGTQEQNWNMVHFQVSGAIWNPSRDRTELASVHGLCNGTEEGKCSSGREMVLSRSWQAILEIAHVLFNRSEFRPGLFSCNPRYHHHFQAPS